VRIGLYLAYWPWFSPEEQTELARQADRAGLDSLWVAEAWGQDVVSVLGHLTGVTERIDLGAGLMQIPARSPAMTAMTAATLDTLSGGRFRLGLGLSGPQVSEGWHGVPFARPLRRTREYVEIVRRILARDGPVEYEGQEYRLPVDPDGLGKPLKLMIHPVRGRIPIYLGAIGPKAIEQAAEIADKLLRRDGRALRPGPHGARGTAALPGRGPRRRSGGAQPRADRRYRDLLPARRARQAAWRVRRGGRRHARGAAVRGSQGDCGGVGGCRGGCLGGLRKPTGGLPADADR
jgi:hypothetical protein